MYRLKPISPDVPARIPLTAEYCKKDEDMDIDPRIVYAGFSKLSDFVKFAENVVQWL